MKTEDLQELLEAGRETPKLDYKASCKWNVVTFAKDILAMSNLEDGGNIVIGVDELENGQFDPKGVTPEHKASYRLDTMKDQMAAFADPYVDFSVHLCDYEKNRSYVVIRVYPFKDIPVICKKDAHDPKNNKLLTQHGVLYFRNNDKRVQSAPISNAHDLRTIIEIAALMKMRKLHSMIESVGLKITPKRTVSEMLDQEIKDL